MVKMALLQSVGTWRSEGDGILVEENELEQVARERDKKKCRCRMPISMVEDCWNFTCTLRA